MSPGLGIGRGHGLHVVRGVLAQRHLDGLGADETGGPLAGLVTWVGHHEAPSRPRESQHGPVQGIARAGERQDIFARQALDFRQEGGELERLLVAVTASLLNDLVDGLGRLGARPHRVFVGVDSHGVSGHSRHGREPLRKRRLVIEGKCRARCHESRQTGEIATSETAADKLTALLTTEQVFHRVSLPEAGCNLDLGMHETGGYPACVDAAAPCVNGQGKATRWGRENTDRIRLIPTSTIVRRRRCSRDSLHRFYNKRAIIGKLTHFVNNPGAIPDRSGNHAMD